jgi:hypothetical protein
MTECTVPEGETIAQGDAVCAIGFDIAENRPTVKRATRDNLATSKTVFGVAKDDADGASVLVLVAGEVVENALTRLGSGNSRIIATDINQGATADQCRLIRADRPEGSEFVVGTCDENGHLTIQPRASRDKSTLHAYNVRAYGAVPNWDGTTASNNGTANLRAFTAALAAMKADSNRNTKLVADGWFYLSDTLHINQSIIFEGTGRSEPEGGGGARSWPGTWLVFPVNKDGIVLHSGFDEGGGADFTVLRNLTVSCDGSARPVDQTGHGIWIHCPATIEHVTVEFFGQNGIFVDAGSTPPGHHGIAGPFLIEKCSVGGCGGDGIHTLGSDANVGLISCCNSVANAGWGFFDETTGNTYVACQGEGNLGYDVGFERSYKAPGLGPGTNTSVFLSCYTEGPAKNELDYPVMVIGGDLADEAANIGEAFSLGQGGRVSNHLLYYVNEQGPETVQIEFGQPRNERLGGVLNFFLPNRADPNVIRYNADTGWWGLNNSTDHSRPCFRFPTTVAAPRRVAPLFENGIYYGTATVLGDVRASKALTNHIGGTGIPSPHTTGGTWEVGDVVWNSAPVPGGPIGWICTTAGTEDAELVGVTCSVDAMDGTKLTLNVLPGSLARWQYITIAGVAGVYRIVNDPGHPAPDPDLTVRIYPAAPAGAGPGAVTFSRTTFSSFGPVENIGVSTSYGAADSPHALLPSERYVTITSDATMTLPAVPVDGQTYGIKSKAGVTTTIDPNGNTIDGQHSVTLAPGDNGTFRYSAAAGEWEIR